MAKRPKLRMTNADYVAIAVSPALIMALVGSLVFFLIEVLYVGNYPARVTYVFALFVFATVLIARIAIEQGNDHAAMFAIPLGLAMFVVLATFVDHDSPFTHLINISLLGIVWWSAHKLTVNCTLINDSEDASGEGLMQHLGVDEVSTDDDHNVSNNANDDANSNNKTPAARLTNELLADASDDGSKKRNKPPHTPGLWVLYFSLAALPLFGIGQKWIPASDVGSRRYAFGLLFVYVAAGLALLVTTSFLGLRRYLRQRKVEMPTSMAATWVATGGVLIVVVMLLAALVPRPSAEYAISQVPWQAGSREDLTASRTSLGKEGVEDDNPDADKSINDETDPNATETRAGDNPTESSDQGEKQTSGDESKGDQAESADEKSDSGQNDKGEASESNSSDKSESDYSQAEAQTERQSEDSPEDESQAEDHAESAAPEPEIAAQEDSEEDTKEENENSNSNSSPSRSPSIPDLSTTITGGLAGLLKIVLYAAITLALGYLAWRHRREIRQAIVELIQLLRDLLARLLGREPTKPASAVDDEKKKPSGPPPRAFASFVDPFANGQYNTMPPDELVRYTFEAFAAWAREHDVPHRPDQTPAELIRLAVPRQSELYAEAQKLSRLYNEAAYAPATVSADHVACLAQFWTLLRRTTARPPETAIGANSA